MDPENSPQRHADSTVDSVVPVDFGNHQCSQPIRTAATAFNPFVHPTMIPQLNFYWPYFTQFPFVPQLQPAFFPVWPFPALPWYYFQQHMAIPQVYLQSMLAASFAPPPYILPQSTNCTNAQCLGTSITNIVTFNEIGNDNSTNVEIRKNGRHVTSSS